MRWRDSPLVLALRHGRVLVLDEADKAPLEVVAILKSLLADGHMRLSDGRRVLSPALAAAAERAGDAAGGARAHDDVLTIHPEFRVLALANRPRHVTRTVPVPHRCAMGRMVVAGRASPSWATTSSASAAPSSPRTSSTTRAPSRRRVCSPPSAQTSRRT